MTMDILNKTILGLFKAETFSLKFLMGGHSCHPWIGFPTLIRHCRLIGQALFSRSQVFVFLMDCHNLFLLLVSVTKIRIYSQKHNISTRILVSLPCVTISQRTPEPNAESSLLELCWGNGVLGQSQRTIHPPPASSPSEAAFTLRRASVLFSLWRLIDLIFTISFIRFCFWVIHCWLTAFPMQERVKWLFSLYCHWGGDTSFV